MVIRKFKLVSDFDANLSNELSSSTMKDALHEALEILGYSVIEVIG